MKAIRRESGNHLMPKAPVAMSVKRRASPPSGAMRYTCASSSSFAPSTPRRLATKAIQRPSGDQAGSPSFSPAEVRRRGSPPKPERIQRLDRAAFSFMSYAVEDTQTRAPSGERVGCEGRSSFQRSSTVRRCLVIGVARVAARHSSASIDPPSSRG
jgi:hypothetical protein